MFLTRCIRSVAGRWAPALLFTCLSPGTSPGQTDPDGVLPGRLVDLGEYRLHLDCRGQARPAVVIDAGGGAWSIFFRHIQRALVESGVRVCTYDRAGLGWSDPAIGPRTSRDMATDLHELLETAGELPPYVLVGHSLGGLNVRFFTARYPEDVAGLVLAEAAHENQWERLPNEAWEAVARAIPRLEQAAQAARAGAIPPSSIDASSFAVHLPELSATYVQAMTTAKPYEGLVAELQGVEESHSQVAEVAGPLGDLPLAVVSAGNSFAAFEGSGIPIEEANRVWADLQKELASLSSQSRQIVSAEAEHGIQFSDPEALLDGIEWVLYRLGRRSSGPPQNDSLAEERVLPYQSTPEVDRLLAKLESVYADMNIDGFVRLFTDDFVQLDVNRRVRVEGAAAWRDQTRRINAAHRSMERRHFGRIWTDPWLIVEIEWAGTIRGEAIGQPDSDGDYRYSGVGLIELRDGRIRRQVLWGDYATLLEQLGPAVARPSERP